MSAMFELCCLHCEYAELHAPSSFGLDELLTIYISLKHFKATVTYAVPIIKTYDILLHTVTSVKF